MNIHDALVYIAKMIYRYNNCKIFHFYTHTHTHNHTNKCFPKLLVQFSQQPKSSL